MSSKSSHGRASAQDRSQKPSTPSSSLSRMKTSRIADLEAELARLRDSTTKALKQSFAEEESLCSQLSERDELVSALRNELVESRANEADWRQRYLQTRQQLQETSLESVARLKKAEREAAESKAREAQQWRKKYEQAKKLLLSEWSQSSSFAAAGQVDRDSSSSEYQQQPSLTSRSKEYRTEMSAITAMTLALRSLTTFSKIDDIDFSEASAASTAAASNNKSSLLSSRTISEELEDQWLGVSSSSMCSSATNFGRNHHKKNFEGGSSTMPLRSLLSIATRLEDELSVSSNEYSKIKPIYNMRSQAA